MKALVQSFNIPMREEGREAGLRARGKWNVFGNCSEKNIREKHQDLNKINY